MYRYRFQTKIKAAAAVVLLAAFLGALVWPCGAPAALAPETFAEIAQKDSPAVVNISTEKVVKGRTQRSREFFGPGPMPFGPHDPFRDFFEKFFGDLPRDFKQRSLGSGFIIDPKGLIITNNHVVEGADKIKVKLVGGKEYNATVKGRDPKTDLALLEIKASESLPYLTLGNSDAVRVGDWVVAVGNPFGLGHTVTQGIISAKGRVIGAGPYDNFLQTDAAINPGNSGGPLLNLKGEVIGINTAIVATGQGIGFAIPSNLAKSFKLPEPKGALVAEVNPGTPADKAGLQRGDIIIEFDGKPIKEMNELPRLVAATPPGTKVTVKFLRDGKEKSVTLTLAEMQEERTAAVGGETPEESALGLVVDDVNPNLARRFGLKESRGALVVQVAPGSPAQDAGLRPGDLILDLNGHPVKNAADFQRQLAGLEKGSVARLLVKRQGQSLYFPVEIPEK